MRTSRISGGWAISRSTWAPATTSSTPFIPAQSVPDSNFCQGLLDSQISQHAELERLGDSNRHGLGRVRQRQDGRESVRRPIHCGRGVLADLAVQSDLQPPGHADLDRPQRRRQGSQSRRVAVSSTKSAPGSANFGSPDTVDKQDPDLKRDKNWTYELTAQQELFSGVQVFGGYYRRHFYDLAWTDNLATANFVDANNPGDWIPFTYIGPADPNFPNGGNEAITMYNLQPNKIPAVNPGRVTRRTRPTTSAPTTASRSAPTSGCQACVRDGQPDQRQDAHPRLHGRQPQQPQVLRSDGSVPPHHEVRRQLSAAVRDHAERRTSRFTIPLVQACFSRRRTTRRTCR